MEQLNCSSLDATANQIVDWFMGVMINWTLFLSVFIVVCNKFH